MAKNFKFKLEGLLKLRSFHEEKIKVELGKLISEESSILRRLKEIDKEVGMGYEMHEKAFSNVSKGRDAAFYPYYFQGKRQDRERCENMLYVVRKKIDLKREELAKAMGDVKIMENLKDKKKVEFQKEIQKKEENDIEENVIMGFSKKRGLL